MAADVTEGAANRPSPRMTRFGLRRLILAATPVLRRLGLLGPLFRIYERLASFHLSREPKTAPDGLPIPPRHLRMLVSGTSLDDFLVSGKVHADRIAELIGETGVKLDDARAVLDFGCGSGRIARHWAALPGRQIYASDYNPQLVSWCAKNLPHVNAGRNELDPPLSYGDGMFDAIYAISVFTHLDEARQYAWMAELTRVLAPGGRLLFTVHGEAARPFMTDEERAAFEAGQPVVRFDEHAGSNLCSTYHPREWVERDLLTGLEPLHFVPAGPASISGVHDVFVAGKPAG